MGFITNLKNLVSMMLQKHIVIVLVVVRRLVCKASVKLAMLTLEIQPFLIQDQLERKGQNGYEAFINKLSDC